jgi:DNA-binding NarL/FixJ family response regulator
VGSGTFLFGAVRDLPIGPQERDMADKHLTCLIIDTERMFLDLLSGMLSLRGGLRVVAERTTGSKAERTCREHKPDILIMCLPMADAEIEDLLSAFSEVSEGGHLIVIKRGNTDELPALLENKDAKVIHRDAPFGRLRKAVDSILGNYQLPLPKHDESFAEKPLSVREAEIFTYIGEGLTNREIASRLDLSVHTVQAHRRRISVKLGTRRSELAHRAIAARRVFLDPVT